MAASICYCRYCPPNKRENKRSGRKEIRAYHKLLRRLGKAEVRRELALS